MEATGLVCGADNALEAIAALLDAAANDGEAV